MRNLFKSDIVRLQKPISEIKYYSVYFLLHKDEIVYVGFSETPYNRISAHFQDKTFDAYFIIPFADKEEGLLTETHYIQTLCPFYNKKDNPSIVPMKRIPLYNNGSYSSKYYEIVKDIIEPPKIREKEELLNESKIKINIPTGTYIKKLDNKYYFNIKGKVYTYEKESNCYELNSIIYKHPKNTYGNVVELL